MVMDRVLEGLRLIPEEVAEHEFAHGFRGYDVGEVRAFLLAVSGEMRRLKDQGASSDALGGSISEAAAGEPVLSRENLTAMVGDEAASVLRAAEDAAGEIRRRAEENVERMLREARSEAARIRTSADQESADLVESSESVRADGQDQAATILAEAEVDAQKVRDEAVEQGRSMLSEAQGAREHVLGDLASKRKKARRELLQLRAGIDQLHESYDELRSMLDTSSMVVTGAVDDARRAAADAAHSFDRSDSEDDLGAVRSRVAELGYSTDELDGSVEAAIPEPVEPAVEVAEEVAPGLAVDEVPTVEDAAAVREASHRTVYRREPTHVEDPLDEVTPSDKGSDTSEVEDDDAGSGDEGSAALEVDDDAVEVEADDAGSGDEGSDTFAVEEDHGRGIDEELSELPDLLDDGPVPPPVEVPPLFGRRDTNVDELFKRIRTSREDAVSQARKVLGAADMNTSKIADPQDEVVDVGSDVDNVPAATASRVERDSAGLFADLDLVVDELSSGASRILKRRLADQLNEVLDVSRRAEGKGTLDELIPEESTAEYGALLVDVLTVAARRGAGSEGAIVDISAIVDVVSRDVGGALRTRVGAYLSEEEGLDQRIRAAYREWRRERADEVALIAISGAFNLGILSTLSDSDSVRWAQRDDGCQYPDCGDNALATGLHAGEAFPTGHTVAPLGPGCRCLVVAADG